MIKIAIIGYGFVGKALHEGFTDEVDVKIIDPALGASINELLDFKPKVIFICVPTPMAENDLQDLSIIKSVLNDLLKFKINSLIVIKSTVLPNFLVNLQKKFPRIVYNPEFLREKHAKEDFINSKLIVFGGNTNDSHSLARIYEKYTVCKSTDYIFTDVATASLIKYTINSFLSLKVTFFNELKDLFDVSDSTDDWSNFIQYLTKDTRMGASHMNVPGHDGRRGYGGACLPKDSEALSRYADIKNRPLNVLKKSINTNNKIRAEYNDHTERELEQGINFYKDVEN